jgi:antitoxin MazE
MEIAIRNIGNSKGVVIPKLLLAQAGLEGESTALIQVVKGSIVLSKSSKPLRAGWAEAAAAVCAHGNFNLMMGEFGNVDDAELRW